MNGSGKIKLQRVIWTSRIRHGVVAGGQPLHQVAVGHVDLGAPPERDIPGAASGRVVHERGPDLVLQPLGAWTPAVTLSLIANGSLRDAWR